MSNIQQQGFRFCIIINALTKKLFLHRQHNNNDFQSSNKYRILLLYWIKLLTDVLRVDGLLRLMKEHTMTCDSRLPKTEVLHLWFLFKHQQKQQTDVFFQLVKQNLALCETLIWSSDGWRYPTLTLSVDCKLLKSQVVHWWFLYESQESAKSTCRPWYN